MGIMDMLEDYHPERLTLDEVYAMVESAKYGTSAYTETEILRENTNSSECVDVL